jgi:hypothetical protein
MKSLLFVILILALALSACSPAVPTPTVTPQPDGPIAAPTATATVTPSGPITPTLAVKINIGGENPHPMGGIAIGLVLTPNVDAPNINMTMTMPSEIGVLTGSPTWAGDLKANQSLGLNLLLTIEKLSQPGVIKVEVYSYPTNAAKFGTVYSLYVRPTPDGKIDFSTTPFTN